MTPLSHAVTELRLVVDHAEARKPKPGTPVLEMEDHRTGVIAELCDALDRVDHQLGTRLLLAMYPHIEELPTGELAAG